MAESSLAQNLSAGGDSAGESTRERIIAAALRQCEQVGLRRTTVEDVARRAQLARVTIYRHFPTKDALVQAVILQQTQRFFDTLDSVLAGCSSADESVVEGFAFALDYVGEHRLLKRLLETEPETLLPYLVGNSPLVTAARERVAERIDREFGTPSGGDSAAIAELIVRFVLSLVVSPETVLGLDSAEGRRRFARRYLVGGLHRTGTPATIRP